jgi:hypothetical protein
MESDLDANKELDLAPQAVSYTEALNKAVPVTLVAIIRPETSNSLSGASPYANLQSNLGDLEQFSTGNDMFEGSSMY